ncbi:hypothetical protein HXA31_18005 [Salipaludibacillus agaradhaerens]|uniref:Uncharacterized protein n=1 Tax=Salipaludibacillus agaradhaerens TaxID=76935 RepID=A0A9Q4B4F3_SALAG|nr:hypothetical protein [Salipaludibacillus agaradhaerens]MCR6098139.1 hypothetical protein [Salipaludibacillus agaradhaerens]MCR6116231.1 hypothetical protein [Salipaludibacillus agaradhaerens]
MTKKRVIVIVCLLLVIVGGYIAYLQLKDEKKEIEEIARQYNRFMMEIDIEVIEGQYAVALYNWGYPYKSKFGMMEFEKTFWGWEIVTATSDRMVYTDYPAEATIFPVYNELSEFTVLGGRVSIGRVLGGPHELRVETAEGEVYEGSEIIITDNNIWYIISEDKVDFSGSRITALSEDGDIIDEIYIYDEHKVNH